MRMDDAPEEPSTVEDAGLSLEDLGEAYAALLNRGAVPYEEPKEGDAASSEVIGADSSSLTDSDRTYDRLANETCELSPKSILEAMLFVGHPLNEPLTARQVASLMRGVLPEEVDELVRELNAEYAQQGCPYQIASEGPGYRLGLRDEFAGLREQFYGRVKEAKLSQAAIDTLAIVAYHQPVGVKQIDDLRGKPSGGILSQLVRRQLVKIERTSEKPREIAYRTTPRFLDLFGLESLNDLPRSHDLER